MNACTNETSVIATNSDLGSSFNSMLPCSSSAYKYGFANREMINIERGLVVGRRGGRGCVMNDNGFSNQIRCYFQLVSDTIGVNDFPAEVNTLLLTMR